MIKQIKKYHPYIGIILISNSFTQKDRKRLKRDWIKCFSEPLDHLEELSMSIELPCIQRRYEYERKISNKLHELSLAINAATELQEIFDITCKAAVDILNVDHSGLVLFQKNLTKGIFYAEYPSEVGIKGRIIRVKDLPMEEKLVHKRKIINISDVKSAQSLEAEFSQDLKSTLLEYGILSCLFVPVVLNEKVIASFSLDMIRRHRRFYRDEIELSLEKYRKS